MIDTTTPQSSCPHCGFWHSGPCLRIKAIEYYPDGTLKRVEYIDQPPHVSDGINPLIPSPPGTTIATTTQWPWFEPYQEAQ